MNECGDAAIAIPFSFPGLDRVKCLFSTRHGGDMRLDDDAIRCEQALANRRRFMRLAGFGRWAGLRQVHGDALAQAQGGPRVDTGETVAADALYTLENDLGLIIKTADCQPLFFARRDGGAAAGVHLGWRGNAGKYLATIIPRLCRAFSCGAADLLAVRGPSLGPAAAEFVNFQREWPPEFAPWFNPANNTVNLWELTRKQLEEAGLRRENIHSLDMCTHTMAGTFFSHRRKDSGRMVNAVWLE